MTGSRHALTALACVLALLAAPPAPALAADDGAPGMAHATPEMPLSIAASAASWQPAVIADPDALIPGPPPAWKSAAYKAEMDEILAWQQRRTPDDLKAIANWKDTPVPMRWSEAARAEITAASLAPPRGACGDRYGGWFK